MPGAANLFERLVDPEHLALAARRTVRGKRRRPDVAWALFQGERMLAELEAALRAGTWQPGPFEVLLLRDPKPRVIARASVADRIVHRALTLLLEPVILRSCVASDLACRPGGGTHRAWLRLLRAMRRRRFFVHLDVRAYFPSIDPDRVLLQLPRCVQRDEAFLTVLARLLARGRGLYDSPAARRHARLDPDWPPPGRGLPMGASTSQLLAAHLHLQGLDHFLLRRLRVPAYVRYVDDLFLFGDRRADLRAWRREVARYLAEELDLRLKRPEAPVLACAGHLDGLGARITRAGIQVAPRAWRRMRGRIGSFVRERGRTETSAGLRRSLAGQAGMLFFG
jgi:hypothetical protein